jgi:hypothetical protein
MRPACFIARRHHIGVARERKVWRAAADLREQVVDVGGIHVREGDAMHFVSGVAQNFTERLQRAAFRGRHGRAAD